MNYYWCMEFEWDEAKSEDCARTRRFNFAYAARAFFDPDRIVEADTRHSYDEDRYRLMGKIDDRIFIVIYTPRNEFIRIISARKANQREIRYYEDCTRED